MTRTGLTIEMMRRAMEVMSREPDPPLPLFLYPRDLKVLRDYGATDEEIDHNARMMGFDGWKLLEPIPDLPPMTRTGDGER